MSARIKVCDRCGGAFRTRWNSERTYCLQCWHCLRCGQKFNWTAGPQLYCSTACYLWSKVSIGADGGCWPWMGAKDLDGYGIMRTAQKSAERVVRVIFKLRGDPVPTDLVVMHACDNPACCNPAHLSKGTVTDNNRDREAKGRGRYARHSA